MHYAVKDQKDRKRRRKTGKTASMITIIIIKEFLCRARRHGPRAGSGPRTCYIRPSDQVKKYKKPPEWWRLSEWI